ncbi:MAG TPA: N-acetyl sugar amidotransferase [Gemmatimonadaceae bacterium]|nr:N-acetyl sugar amidotransferase [Gemmatimonadaceae bacterium]
MSEHSFQPPASAADAAETRPYRQCSVSVLDTLDDPNMLFDEQGRCHYYHDYMRAERAYVRTGEAGRRELEQMVDRVKQDGRKLPYDCIIGVSGGVDSTYLAYLVKQLGLRPLAVHFDNGWNSELAVTNVENIVNRLGIDLFTYVVNWEEFRDLQLAYLRASVVDIEVVSDHAIMATMWRTAAKHGVRHILSGTNIVTEHVLPPHWIYNKSDHVNLRAIHKAFGRVPLDTYPLVDWRVKRYMHGVRGIRTREPLNLVPYDKAEIKRVITSELGWRDYGGKHYESIWTRFYQGYILPTKFGIDKRKAHLSNLIFSRQITKEHALAELAEPMYEPALLRQDMDFVLKKLELTAAEFERIMRLPPRAHREFDYERPIYDDFPVLRPFRGAIAGFRRLVSAS